MLVSSFLFQIRLLLGTLGPVLGPTLLTILNSESVKRPSHNVIPHAWEVLHPTTTDKNNTVLLQVMTLPTNIGNDLKPVC